MLKSKGFLDVSAKQPDAQHYVPGMKLCQSDLLHTKVARSTKPGEVQGLQNDMLPDFSLSCLVAAVLVHRPCEPLPTLELLRGSEGRPCQENKLQPEGMKAPAPEAAHLAARIEQPCKRCQAHVRLPRTGRETCMCLAMVSTIWYATLHTTEDIPKEVVESHFPQACYSHTSSQNLHLSYFQFPKIVILPSYGIDKHKQTAAYSAAYTNGHTHINTY